LTIFEHSVPNSDMWQTNYTFYEGNSISKLQIQLVNYVFELSAGNYNR
jgi:hypothetical protein